MSANEKLGEQLEAAAQSPFYAAKRSKQDLRHPANGLPRASTESYPEWKKHTYNYDALARLIGSHPPLAIFRSYATLNAKNLLYLQAELAELEDELSQLERRDQISDDANARQFQWEVRRLAKSEGEQWKKVLEVRAKLKEYNQALLQFKSLNALQKPYDHNITKLREWLDREDYGAMFLERPETVYDSTRQEEQNNDLVDVSARTQGDRFSRFLTYKVVPWLHRHIFQRPGRANRNSDRQSQIYDYSDRLLEHIAEVLSIVVSTLLPTISMFALYYIENTTLRLVFILCFSAVFTASLAVFTNARRIEIFAAVVAMASIQVVFIGTNGGGP
jgi:YD repeat-containing protein